MVVHVDKSHGLLWSGNDGGSGSVQVLETFLLKVDESHVSHEVIDTRLFAEASFFFKLTGNTGSLGDSSDNTFAVLLVVLLVDSTPDSSGKIGGSSDGTSEVSQETEVLELNVLSVQVDKLVDSIAVVRVTVGCDTSSVSFVSFQDVMLLVVLNVVVFLVFNVVVSLSDILVVDFGLVNVG